MVTLSLQIIIWLSFSILPALFAIYFGYMFAKDKDKRKLMFTLTFAFASLAFFGKIIPQSLEFSFVDKLYSYGTIPMITAVFLSLLSVVSKAKNFEKLFKIFIISFIITIILVFIPLDSYFSWLLFTQVFGFSAFLMSLHLTIRKRRLGDLLFLLAIISFIADGFGLALGFGLAFDFLCYVFSFVFIGLVFSFASTDDKWGTASFFKIQQQLDETKSDLKKLEVEYRAIFESVNDAIFVADTKTGLIIDCNFEATKLVGRPKKDIVGKHQSMLHPQEASDGGFSESIGVQTQAKTEFIETQIITKNGEIKDVSIKAGVFEVDHKKLMVGVFRDITLKKRTEKDLVIALESLSDNLKKIQELNEKLNVVGSITRHDARNKLSAINCYVYILKKKFTQNQEIVGGLSKIEQSVKETAQIFDFAKMYEEIGVKELVKVIVEEVIQEAIALFSGSMPKIIDKCQGLEVFADSLLRQLFYNLIDNTRKYGQKTTMITISYQNIGGDYIKIIYEDDGVGISAENKLKMFSQGFSTGGSTGLGLFLIQKMVEVYGWTIIEEGIPGQGVRFVITVPTQK